MKQATAGTTATQVFTFTNSKSKSKSKRHCEEKGRGRIGQVDEPGQLCTVCEEANTHNAKVYTIANVKASHLPCRPEPLYQRKVARRAHYFSTCIPSYNLVVLVLPPSRCRKVTSLSLSVTVDSVTFFHHKDHSTTHSFIAVREKNDRCTSASPCCLTSGVTCIGQGVTKRVSNGYRE